MPDTPCHHCAISPSGENRKIAARIVTVKVDRNLGRPADEWRVSVSSDPAVKSLRIIERNVSKHADYKDGPTTRKRAIITEGCKFVISRIFFSLFKLN